jgi:hypothetical protein
MKQLSTLFIGVLLAFSVVGFGQKSESPWIWGPNLGVIGEDFVAISWNTSRAVGVDLYYATAATYGATANWEETLTFEPHTGVAEIRLGDLLPETTYYYQAVIYEGDALYPRPVGHFTTSSAETESFSFLVYGDTQTFPDRHKLVADTMAQEEPDASFVVHTGDLVEPPTPEQFQNFFWAVDTLIRTHPYLTVFDNHENGNPYYYEFFSLPAGGGESNEQWWSFDYGNIHLVGLDSTLLTDVNAGEEMQNQTDWLQADLSHSGALVKIVFFSRPFYASAIPGGVDEALRDLWEPVFLEHHVDIVFTGHMHCYEHLYVNGIHYIVTGGGGAPLQEPSEEAAEGMIFHRYGMLHYMRITVKDGSIKVEAVPVASVYNSEVLRVPTGRPIDSFTITKTSSSKR